MDLSKHSSASLRNLAALMEKREALLAELEKLDSTISVAIGSGASAPTKTEKILKAGRHEDGKRGALKDAILAELRAAGESGVSVKALALKLGAKNKNLHVWFATTGKKLGVRKTGHGKYSL